MESSRLLDQLQEPVVLLNRANPNLPLDLLLLRLLPLQDLLSFLPKDLNRAEQAEAAVVELSPSRNLVLLEVLERPLLEEERRRRIR